MQLDHGFVPTYTSATADSPARSTPVSQGPSSPLASNCMLYIHTKAGEGGILQATNQATSTDHCALKDQRSSNPPHTLVTIPEPGEAERAGVKALLSSSELCTSESGRGLAGCWDHTHPNRGMRARPQHRKHKAPAFPHAHLRISPGNPLDPGNQKHTLKK